MATTYTFVQQLTGFVSALSQQFTSSETLSSQENPVYGTMSVPADGAPYAVNLQGADRVRAFCAGCYPFDCSSSMFMGRGTKRIPLPAPSPFMKWSKYLNLFIIKG